MEQKFQFINIFMTKQFYKSDETLIAGQVNMKTTCMCSCVFL